ncbi:hypothetical protein FOMPIDRAFT_64904, partial [Fomitopsis schrenkii]
CVTFYSNLNLLVFGLEGKDWSAGTQDSWVSGAHLSLSLVKARTSHDMYIFRHGDQRYYLRMPVLKYMLFSPYCSLTASLRTHLPMHSTRSTL